MQDKIKELELDLKELKFLLEELKGKRELILIAERCTGRLINSLKEIQGELKSMGEDGQSNAVFGEQLKTAVELTKAFSLNDIFRFSRELFDGDADKMNHILKEIGRMATLADVTAYLSSQIQWNEEDEVTKEFIELLKKYFV